MRRRKNQRGEIMLEFALVMPVLFLLCFGAMDLSRVFRTAMVSSAAARAGVHYASLGESSGEDTTGIINAAKNDAANPAGMTVAVDRYCTCALGGEQVPCEISCSNKSKYVKVTARMPFTATLSLPGISSSFNMTTTSHVRVK
jgi:Flp pilus assembly protein TadG